jgi:RNA polymerase sigma factor for flagellar operon FliA
VAITRYYEQQQREALITEHLNVVKFQALRMYARLPSSIQMDDLYNYGIIGLIDAVDKYDSSRGVKLKTYAELRVRGAILDGLRELDWVPRSYRRRQREVEAAFHKIEGKLGRAGTDNEVAEELNIPLDDYYSWLDNLKGVNITPIEATDSENEEGPHFSVPDKESNSPEKVFEKKQIKVLLADYIDTLPEKERMVLSLYYFESLTMKEVGKVLKITESRISQLHSQAIMRLRSKMKQAFGKE